MENEKSGFWLKTENLEEGEVCDSDEGSKNTPEKKSGNARQKKGTIGQIWALQCTQGDPVKCEKADSEDSDGSPVQQRTVQQYFDFDKVHDEDNWTQNVSFKRKKKFQDGIDDFKYKGNAFKRKGNQSQATEGKSNNSVSANDRSTSPNSGKAKNKFKKLGALCIKPKKKKFKRKRKPYRSVKEEKGDRPVCKFFIDGNCAKGDECQFFHPRPKRTKKKRICKFFLNGDCTKGEFCDYMHGEFPCKYFHTGTVCYSKENCRFSHKPLTEEMSILLDKYLNGGSSKEDDDNSERYHPRHFKPEKSKDPKVKRKCLLGSPPRYIKESAETKKWQREMKIWQQSSRNGSAFKIHISPVKEPTSSKVSVKEPMSSKFSGPSFYVDTLRSPSPKKRSPLEEISDSVSSSKSHDVPNQPSLTALIKEENGKGIPSAAVAAAGSVHIKKEKDLLDASGDTESIEESQKASSPAVVRLCFYSLESKESLVQDSEKFGSPKGKTYMPVSESYPQPEVTLPSISISGSLPRTERAYFPSVRVKEERIPSEESASYKIVPGASVKEEFVTTLCENNEPVVVKKEYSYSSDDDETDSSEDDDDTDQSLTDELFDMPCPEEDEKPPANSPFNIMQMIKLERQKATEKPQASAYHETKAYWENIMSSSAPSSTRTSTSVSQNFPSIQPTPQSPKDMCASTSGKIKTEPISTSGENGYDQRKKFPDLKSYIPRDSPLQISEQQESASGLLYFPSTPFSFGKTANTCAPLTGAMSGNQLPNRFRDISSISQNSISSVVNGLHGCGFASDKLREVPMSSSNPLSHESNHNAHLREHVAQGSSALRQSDIPSVVSAKLLICDISSNVQNEGNLGEKVSFSSECPKFKNTRTLLQDVDPPMCKTETVSSLHDASSAASTSGSELVPSCRPHRTADVRSPGQLSRSFADPRFVKLLRPGSLVQRKKPVNTASSQHISAKKIKTEPICTSASGKIKTEPICASTSGKVKTESIW